MNIAVTGRHIEVTPALKQYAVDKIERMNKYSAKIIDVNVILTVEKYRHIAEINMWVGKAKFTGKEATEDMYSSIDKALEKIERQLRKHKEKLSDHNARASQVDKFFVTEEEDLSEEAEVDYFPE